MKSALMGSCAHFGGCSVAQALANVDEHAPELVGQQN
jgi:hypothetical protein